MNKNRQTQIIVVVLSIIVVAIGSIATALSNTEIPVTQSNEKTAWINAIVAIIVSLIGGAAAIYVARESTKEAIKEKERIAEAESKVETQPEKARPAWDLARVTLDAYFNRNLSQITYIFWFSVFVMAIGFAVIVWGISQSVNSPNAIAPAGIAVLAGVVTEFIGATFIFIYRSTLHQALNYAKALERINSVGMAMQILDTMPDEAKPDDLKSKTKAALIELLIKQTHDTSTVTQTDEKK